MYIYSFLIRIQKFKKIGIRNEIILNWKVIYYFITVINIEKNKCR